MSRGYFDCACCNAIVCGGVEDSDLCDVCLFKGCDEEGGDPCCRECILDGSRGIYLPSQFASEADMTRWGVAYDDVTVLRAGPDHEHYWEVWGSVLDTAEFTDPDGSRWCLEQDGDLFAVCIAPPEGFEVAP